MRFLWTALLLAVFAASAPAGAGGLGPDLGPIRAVATGTGTGTGTVETVTGDTYIIVDATDPANLLLSLDTSDIVRKGSASVISSTVDITGGLGIPNGTSCTSTTAGRVCLDTNGITEYTDPVLTVRTGGANKPIPIFTSLGTAGVAALFGKNASNAGTVYPIATTPTADAVPLANGSGKIDGGWLLGVPNGGTVAARQATTPTTNSIAVWDGTKYVDQAGLTAVAGVIYSNGSVISSGGVVAKTFTGSMQWSPNNTETCFDFAPTRVAFNTLNGTAAEWRKVPALNPLNPVTFGSLTARFGPSTTPANWAADEMKSFYLYTCTTFDGTTGPRNTSCTKRDKLVIENVGGGSANSYGVDRTAVDCGDGTNACRAAIPLDGKGVSPQGTVSFAAGAVDFFMVCVDMNDDADYTADGTADPGTFEAIFSLTVFN